MRPINAQARKINVKPGGFSCYTALVIDLHCHILPAVDDGAPNVSVAMAMARALVDAGVRAIAPSPHYGLGPGGDVTIERAQQARLQLEERLHDEKIDLQLLPNAEHHLTSEMFDRLAQDAYVPVGGVGRWLLTELPWNPIPAAEQLLFRLQAKGVKILLAHPERYHYIGFDMLLRLVERGVRLQLELGSFIGLYGERAKKRAQQLSDAGAVHVLASDLHSDKDAAELLTSSHKTFVKTYGQEVYERLTTKNPQALLHNEDPDSVLSGMENR